MPKIKGLRVKQTLIVTPAGSTHGFGSNDYDNVIYTSNTLWSDDPAFYGPADVHGHSKFGPHSSYYASSLNQSEESLGNGLRDHINEILAGLEGDNAQDAENTAEILASNMEYEMQKKECKAAQKRRTRCYDFLFTLVLLVTPLTHFPIFSHLSYLNGLLVITYDKHAYSPTFCTPFSTYLTHPRITYKYQTHSLYITNLFLPFNKKQAMFSCYHKSSKPL